MILRFSDEERRYSQHGEDGIIDKILSRYDPYPEMFMEFGAGNGATCNVSGLVKRGWSGILIEGSKDDIEILRTTMNMIAKEDDAEVRVCAVPQPFSPIDQTIDIINSFITKEYLDQLLEISYIDGLIEIPIVSVDVDGNDYWFLLSLLTSGIEYDIIICEYNGSALFKPPMQFIMPYNENHIWDGTNYYGASLRSIEMLLNVFGFRLVYVESSGTNAFFMRDEIMKKCEIEEVNSSEVWIPCHCQFPMSDKITMNMAEYPIDRY